MTQFLIFKLLCIGNRCLFAIRGLDSIVVIIEVAAIRKAFHIYTLESSRFVDVGVESESIKFLILFLIFDFFSFALDSCFAFIQFFKYTEWPILAGLGYYSWPERMQLLKFAVFLLEHSFCFSSSGLSKINVSADGA